MIAAEEILLISSVLLGEVPVSDAGGRAPHGPASAANRAREDIAPCGFTVLQPRSSMLVLMDKDDAESVSALLKSPGREQTA